jgi:stress-induced morphogen
MVLKLHRDIYQGMPQVKFESYFKISIFSPFFYGGLSLWRHHRDTQTHLSFLMKNAAMVLKLHRDIY